MTTAAAPMDDHVARWRALAPHPRPRLAGVRWDVFVSYRSLNRAWALALHDTLREVGFEVFLDQFRLTPGTDLESFLAESLEASAAGTVVWSGDAAASDWVRGELNRMRRLQKQRAAFCYVLAKLDDAPLPFLEQGDLYVDFTGYPEGPRGGELLRLMFGLVGQPLSDAAVREIHALDAATTEVLHRIAAARAAGRKDELLRLAREHPVPFHVISLPYAQVADALIALEAAEEALAVLAAARDEFSRSVRLQQLEGLALRRLRRVDEALLVLEDLRQQGHRDPETLGILAATWFQRFKRDGRRIYLERSQQLYAEAFRLAPDNSYVGINAASKALLLGAAADAAALAASVLPLVEQHTDGGDYWATATHAEACVLGRRYADAARLYRAAAVAHAEEKGSIESTRAQAVELLAALGADADVVRLVSAAFVLD